MSNPLANMIGMVVLLSALWISQNSASAPTIATGFSMKLVPRDLLEPSGNRTRSERIERLFEISRGRARYLEHKLSGDVAPEGSAAMDMYRISWYFAAQMAFRTPPMQVFLLVDTGSGAVWTQCMPCIKCFPQLTPIFNSRTSSSFRKLPCTHFLCSGFQSIYQCVRNECVYSMGYAGVGPTKGVASVETIRFQLSDRSTQAIDGIIFGCSNDNSNFNIEGTWMSGVLGLSWSPDSLVRQLAPFINRRFSYCLYPFNQDQMMPSLLTFGSAIPIPRGRVQTMLLAIPPGLRPIYYFYLTLVDVSVGSERLGFPPGMFIPKEDGSRGLIIDSGAPTTLLVDHDLPNGRNAYKDVIGAFQRKYDSMRLRRMRNVTSGLCYFMPAGFQGFVPMTYHLRDADYTVDGRFSNYFNRQDGWFCVSVSGSDTLSINILGASHQQNMRIIFDDNLAAMQFVPEVCATSPHIL